MCRTDELLDNSQILAVPKLGGCKIWIVRVLDDACGNLKDDVIQMSQLHAGIPALEFVQLHESLLVLVRDRPNLQSLKNELRDVVGLEEALRLRLGYVE